MVTLELKYSIVVDRFEKEEEVRPSSLNFVLYCVIDVSGGGDEAADDVATRLLISDFREVDMFPSLKFPIFYLRNLLKQLSFC